MNLRVWAVALNTLYYLAFYAGFQWLAAYSTAHDRIYNPYSFGVVFGSMVMGYAIRPGLWKLK